MKASGVRMIVRLEVGIGVSRCISSPRAAANLSPFWVRTFGILAAFG